jgi:uncharacterized protein with PIN domain
MTSSASFRFYAQLNDFLPARLKDAGFAQSFAGSPAIKDTIEAIGVPHTEVGLIIVNGEPAGFDYHLQAGDRVAVYPPFRYLNLDERAPIFVADVHLGRLAAYLRMLGFDTLYTRDYDDETLANISANEGRILLTRDIGLLKRKIVTFGYFVRETDPWRQLEEILRRFDLMNVAVRFYRCTQCNGELHAVDKAAIADQLMPETRQHYDEFKRCAGCGKIYWRGSHYERLDQFLASLKP